MQERTGGTEPEVSGVVETTASSDGIDLAIALCLLSFGVCLFLLLPGFAPPDRIPTENLHLVVPFALIAVFCFQLGLERFTDDGRTSRSRGRAPVESRRG